MRNLQAAWEAIEKGDRVEAQSIVAQILRDDPKNAEAWMVLGEAVSGERQVLFLRKAVQLDPNLKIAQDRLEALESAQKAVVSDADQDGTELEVPEGVVLDAPTVPIEDRVDAARPAPRPAEHSPSRRSAPVQPQSNIWNTLALIIIALGILAAIFFFIQSLPV